MPSLTAQEIVCAEAVQFARFLYAFKECSSEIQAIILDMAEIVVDPESDEEERGHALDTMLEALLPGYCADVLETHQSMLLSPEGVRAREELDREEATFAETLRRHMEEKGVTQEQLANSAGISQPAISNMLNRKCRPQRRTIEKFAEALGVSALELWPFNK